MGHDVIFTPLLALFFVFTFEDRYFSPIPLAGIDTASNSREL
jgi:hypothetical protein